MPKGSTKLRIAGIIETISTAFVVAVLLYGLFEIIKIGGYLKAVDHDGYMNMILVLALYIAAHIYRFAVSVHVTRRADYADRAGGILGNGIVVLILSVVWLIIVIRAYNNSMKVIEYASQSGAKTLILIMLILSIVDIAMYFLIIVGAVQNMPKNVKVESWGTDPYARYNMPPAGAPYGGQYQNPYNNGYQNNGYPQQGNYPPGYANPYGYQQPQQGGYYQQPYQPQQPYQQTVPQQQYQQPYQPQPQAPQPQAQTEQTPQQTAAPADEVTGE